MGIAQKRGESPSTGSSWEREFAESKKEMGLENRLLDSTPGLKKYPNKVVRLRERGPVSFDALVKKAQEGNG